MAIEDGSGVGDFPSKGKRSSSSPPLKGKKRKNAPFSHSHEHKKRKNASANAVNPRTPTSSKFPPLPAPDDSSNLPLQSHRVWSHPPPYHPPAPQQYSLPPPPARHQRYPSQGDPSQGYPPEYQGYPPQGQPTHNYRPWGFHHPTPPPQLEGYPLSHDYQVYPPQGHPLQGYPPQQYVYHPQENPSQIYVPQHDAWCPQGQPSRSLWQKFKYFWKRRHPSQGHPPPYRYSTQAHLSQLCNVGERIMVGAGVDVVDGIIGQRPSNGGTGGFGVDGIMSELPFHDGAFEADGIIDGFGCF